MVTPGRKFDLFQFPSRVERVPEFVDTLLEPAALRPQHEHELRIALRELLLNAIEHGSLEIGFIRKARAVEDGSWDTLVAERSRMVPHCERVVDVLSHWQRERVMFTVRDQGPGFGSVPPADPMEAARLARNHGMGLIQVRASVDEIAFSDFGNEVTIVKRLR